MIWAPYCGTISYATPCNAGILWVLAAVFAIKLPTVPSEQVAGDGTLRSPATRMGIERVVLGSLLPHLGR